MPSRRSKTDCTEVHILAAREDIGIRRQYPLRTAIGILGNREQAENVVPETFLSAALESDGTLSRNSTRRTSLTDILNCNACDELRTTAGTALFSKVCFINDSRQWEYSITATVGRHSRKSRTGPESRELREAFTGALRNCLLAWLQSTDSTD